ncbi:MAG: carbohydrate-binding family 9-like protein [Bacteroidota bacterium]
MKMVRLLLIILFLGLLALPTYAQEPQIVINPRHYICYRASAPLVIDGWLNEADWQNAEWSEYFVDIEGSLKPEPRYKTRMKMLWDNHFLYIAAELEDPHVWANLTERESVIFNDNDFEVFIDPDGDTHHYLEYEMNALNTQWDLMLLKPYRDDLKQNVAINNWNFNGIKSAVHVNGTLNNPKDTDLGWTVEIAIPFESLTELSISGFLPVEGEQYRIDFSRVEWMVDVIDGKYKKRTHLVNGQEKPLPENNWVWSPQGVIAMHQPETWGFLQFSEKTVGNGVYVYVPDPDNDVKWALRMLYYRENAWFAKHHSYTADLKELGLENYQLNGKAFSPSIKMTYTLYEATLQGKDGLSLWHIVQDGRIWREAR